MTATWFVILGSLFGCLGGAAAQTAGTDRTGSVTGIVTDAVSHLPVRKAAVSINLVSGAGNVGGNQEGRGAVTDASGTFTLSTLQAGQYRLVFQHQNYPQARFGGVAKSVEVKAGETTGPVTVELIPGAAVSGRIEDEDGEPIQGCFVQPHPAKNPEQGVPMSGNSNSNEDGEYRLYGMAPGEYILTAQCQRPVFQPRPFSAGPEPPPTRAYAMQFYPLANDAKGAEVVELTPGAEKPGVDFRMRPKAVTQVHGAFSPGGADWRGSNPVILQLMPLDQSLQRGMIFGGSVDQSKGTFEFRQVFPGSYVLAAFSNGNEETRIGASQRIEVSDQPVDVVLELRHAMDLGGKVEIDTSGNSNGNPKVSLNQIGVQLIPRSQVGLPGSGAQVNDDGSFTLKGVLPGSWRVLANAPFGFVKAVWLGNTDVTNAPMDLSGGAAGGALRIVVSTNTATIRGSAPVGQIVNAQRVDEETPFRSGRGTRADQSGQYKLDGLAPGKYRLAVVDPGSPMPDEGGQEVTVHEGETIMLDLKAQPAP